LNKVVAYLYIDDIWKSDLFFQVNSRREYCRTNHIVITTLKFPGTRSSLAPFSSRLDNCRVLSGEKCEIL